LRTINLIVRGLPNLVLRSMQNFECAYTLWNDLEKHYPNYSLKSLDEILHKTIAFHKMKPNDPNFDKHFLELRDLMRAKGDVRTISNIIIEAIRIHSLDHCHAHVTNEVDDIGDQENDDIGEHGYYDESGDEYEKIMQNFSLMANTRKDY